MKTSTRYVFGAALAGAAIAGMPGVAHHANAALVTNAGFTFDTQTATGTTAAGASFGAFSADVGTGTAYGVHAAANAVYSEPTGNGSAKSFSSNVWGIGDYYQFSVPTINIMGIQVAFDQIGSATGPQGFSLQYSTDGSTFSTLASYTMTTAAPAWSASTSQVAYNHTFDLSAITGLDNDANAVFRIVDTNAVAINGGAVGTGGTDRVDNFVVSGTPVPEPASFSLLTVAAAGLLTRRRSNT